MLPDGRRGSRTPKAASPPVFETGYRAGGSPSVSGPGRRRTCNPPLKRRQLCQLSYGAVNVTGRDRTCDAPRFRRALYRLSYGHARWAEPESNRRPPPYQRGALPPELSAVVAYMCDGRGWDRTSSLLCVRQALSRLSYSPVYSRSGARDRTSISTFRAWCPAALDDPGAKWGASAPPSIPRTGDRRSRRAPAAGDRRVFHVTRGCLPSDVVHATRLPFDPGSPTADAQIRNGRRPTWRGVGARASAVALEKGRQKQTLNARRYFLVRR